MRISDWSSDVCSSDLGFGSEGEAGNDDTGEETDDAPKPAAMSDRLAQRLSAHRTAALQIEMARHPQVALAALVHGMVQTVLQGSHYGHDLPLGVKLTQQDRLEGMAPDWPASPRTEEHTSELQS